VLAPGKVASSAVLTMLAAGRLRVAVRRSGGSLALAAPGGEGSTAGDGRRDASGGGSELGMQRDFVSFPRSFVIVHKERSAVALD
jgi:hypothetical protein